MNKRTLSKWKKWEKRNDQKIEMSYWTHVLPYGNHIGEVLEKGIIDWQ